MDDAAPRWPLSKSITPKALKMFGQCPRQAKFTYIDQLGARGSNSVFLTNGNVAHSLLKHQAYQARAGREFASDERIQEMAFRRLHPPLYPTVEDRALHARDIARWVRYGTAHIDRTAEFLKIEQGDSYTHGIDNANNNYNHNHYVFYGRPDVVMLRADEHGEQFLEFVDYKTGKRRTDDVTPLLIRFAFTKYIQQRFGSTSAIRIVFTWPWLNEGMTDRIEIDREYFGYQWPSVTAEFKALVSEREWPAQPSKLCGYCPYQGTYCTEGLPTS
jgi:hypothetical protein